MRKRVILLLTLLLWANLQVVQAVSPSLQIDPIVVQQNADPGSTVRYTINVENTDRFNSISLSARVADITEDLSGTYRVAPASSTPYSISEWTSVEPTILTIPPGSYGEVTVVAKVPRGTSGGRYGAVVFTPMTLASDSQDAFGTTTFTYEIASILELVVTGVAPRVDAYVDSFKIERSKDVPSIRNLVGDNALVFSAGVSNMGNIHITATGSLMLQTSEGRTVARYPLGGGRGVILPGATMNLQSVPNIKLSPGLYNARAIINYGDRRPLVAETAFEVSENEIVAHATTRSSLPRLSVEPYEITANVRPGASKTEVIEVVNNGAEPVDVEIHMLPLAYDILGDLLPEDERGHSQDWIEVNPSSFSLEPSRTRRVRVSLRPPKDATGGYYTDILVITTDEDANTETGTNLFVFVGEDLERAGSLEVLSVDQEGESLHIDALFVNGGDLHSYIAVELVLNRVYPQTEGEGGRIIAGRTEGIASTHLPTSESPVLPGASRLLSFALPVMPEAGTYELLIRADYGGQKPAVTQLRFEVEGGNGDE